VVMMAALPVSRPAPGVVMMYLKPGGEARTSAPGPPAKVPVRGSDAFQVEGLDALRDLGAASCRFV